jgi:hypothetical protein
MTRRIATTLVLLASLLPVAGPATAEPLVLSDQATIQSVLATHQGKRVTVVLQTGTELTGTVTMVNAAVTQLHELSGKEYFDAVVALPAVAAVVVRTHP